MVPVSAVSRVFWVDSSGALTPLHEAVQQTIPSLREPVTRHGCCCSYKNRCVDQIALGCKCSQSTKHHPEKHLLQHLQFVVLDVFKQTFLLDTCRGRPRAKKKCYIFFSLFLSIHTANKLHSLGSCFLTQTPFFWMKPSAHSQRNEPFVLMQISSRPWQASTLSLHSSMSEKTKP